MTMRIGAGLCVLILGLVLTGCQPPAPLPEPGPAVAAAGPRMTVYKSPSCGCCTAWAERMQVAGFAVSTVDDNNMTAVKERAGIPYGMGSCHTAEVGGYVIEGHVPAQDIQRLLREKPRARGLTVPGMPTGSPGMEQGSRVEPYTVFLIREDGTTEAWAEHGS